MDSIVQKERECLVCKDISNLHCHHVFYGTANRKNSDKYGLTVWLCYRHHNGSNYSVHFNKTLDIKVKQLAQEAFEKNHTRAEFMRIFGKSWL